MDLVLDTNIILACFKPNSITRRLITIDELHLYVPEHQMEEVKRYVTEFAEKYKLTQEFIAETFDFLEEYIRIIPKEDYLGRIKEIGGLISDKDDLPVLALACKLNFIIWSNDAHFKEQNRIRVLTTSEIIELLGKI